ncbi:MAG: ExbD/TolR family protein [Polyangiales bacterium]
MAGISNEGAARGRRNVDREINMVPFIDLLMVTISFLLVTAVWASLARVEAHASAPSIDSKDSKTTEPRALHVDVTRDGRSIELAWQRGTKIDSIASVGFDDRAALLRELSKAAMGANGEPAIVRVPAAMSTGEIVRLFEAISTPRISCNSGSCPAFQPTLSAT